VNTLSKMYFFFVSFLSIDGRDGRSLFGKAYHDFYVHEYNLIKPEWIIDYFFFLKTKDILTENLI